MDGELTTETARYIESLLLLSSAWIANSQPIKCDQTPPDAVVDQPQEDNDYYRLRILSKGDSNVDVERSVATYYPEQTYILRLSTTNPLQTFQSFMITAEDPEVDANIYQRKKVDDNAVGSLKTLDTSISRYSERCANSVENADYSEKMNVEVHWVSPREILGVNKNQSVRIRAMVAKNSEVWFIGDELTVMLTKNNHKSKDSPPHEAHDNCKLCSEARYEVIFNGLWSRVAHPYKYPTKPDENGYSHMVGASHAYNQAIWEKGSMASQGLQDLAESANSTTLEREIINAMEEKTGTRTLIRGKRRHHPYMSEPSHSLFRVDRYHHLFSIAIAMRPSPDWFLGTSNFELCTEEGWLEKYSMPLYPWDAGSRNGVAYESQTSPTSPQHIIDRVEVGSFNRESPFYQMNLNDLKPFAQLIIRRLDVYPIPGEECSEEGEEEGEEGQPVQEEVEEEKQEEEAEEPMVSEVRENLKNMEGGCYQGEWGEWSPCIPDNESCGPGFQTRTRYRSNKEVYYERYNYQDNLQAQPVVANCEGNQDTNAVEYQKCVVNCY